MEDKNQMKARHIRKVEAFSIPSRLLSIEEQLAKGEGKVATWCGETVEPTAENPVLVGLDALLADKHPWFPAHPACQACAQAARAAIGVAAGLSDG